ncbi:MAG: redoxin family protein [Candidatus Kapabacteria bacterium]|nr:redoxin family protein [Candidatus Kapabacteria bacterium]
MKRIKLILILFFVTLNLYSKDSVYVFMATDCPVCTFQTKAINELYNQNKQNFDFVLVFPNIDTSEESILEFNKNFKISIPYIIDSTQNLAKNFKITTIPEVIVRNSNKTIYRGRIDNSFFAPGRKRTITTEFDLKNVLNDLTLNKQIINKETTPIGCVLTYKKGKK